MKKSKSILKKIQNLDVLAFNEGLRNHRKGVNTDLARERAEICFTCEHRIKEPIDELAVRDVVESISEMMCGACGCSLPYLLRQQKKGCSLNKW